MTKKEIDLEKTLIKIKQMCLIYGLGNNYTRCFVEDSVLKIETTRQRRFLFKKWVEHSYVNWLFLDEENQPEREMFFGEHKTLVYR
jgi:hypothetical protein